MALVSAAVLLLFLVSCSARDFTFTFKLGAGKSECFYDYIHEGAFMEVEFQVSCETSLETCILVASWRV